MANCMQTSTEELPVVSTYFGGLLIKRSVHVHVKITIHLAAKVSGCLGYIEPFKKQYLSLKNIDNEMRLEKNQPRLQ